MSPRRSFFMGMVSLGCALACGESEVTPLGTPQLVLSEMRLGGADRVANRIDSDLRFGQTVMEGIGTGDSLWLEVARNLPLKSAAAEANFVIALATALPREPERVLALAGEKTRVELVCGMPFLDSTTAGVSTYYDSAVAALARSGTPSLATATVRCGVALDSARARKLARIDPSYVVKNKPVPPKPVLRRRRSR